MKSETTEKHKKLSSTDITCGVITLSDSITTNEDDLSGQYLADETSKRYTLKSKIIIPDDREALIKTIKEMVDELGVSKYTVRRDFDCLSQRNLAQRTHGGILPVKNTSVLGL